MAIIKTSHQEQFILHCLMHNKGGAEWTANIARRSTGSYTQGQIGKGMRALERKGIAARKGKEGKHVMWTLNY